VVAPRVRELHVVRELASLPAAVVALAREGDLGLTLGAGSIGSVGDRILAALAGAPAANAVAGGSR
jgi:UDP-N-acetylmuramate--alanine ligase